MTLKVKAIDGKEYRQVEKSLGWSEWLEDGIQIKIHLQFKEWMHYGGKDKSFNKFKTKLDKMFPDLSVSWNPKNLYLVGVQDSDCGHLMFNEENRVFVYIFPHTEFSNK